MGCVVSEYPPEVPPLQHHFPMRNWIIAGLSVETVVVEAAERSGALIPADCVMPEGRELLIYADALSSVRSAGVRALCAQGVAAVREVAQLREHAGVALAHMQLASSEARGDFTAHSAPRDWRVAGEWLVASLQSERVAHSRRRGQ